MIDPKLDSGDRLLKAAKAGDRAAFEQLVIRHERVVLATALRLLGTREDAQDAAQEVFVRVHKYLGRFDDAREFTPWLYRMTVNVCRDVARRRHPDTALEAGPAEPPDTAASPDEQARAGEARRILYSALQRLSEKERAVVVLRDLEGLSTSEAARILGSREATVRSHLSRARLKLMKLTERFRRERA